MEIEKGGGNQPKNCDAREAGEGGVCPDPGRESRRIGGKMRGAVVLGEVPPLRVGGVESQGLQFQLGVSGGTFHAPQIHSQVRGAETTRRRSAN